MNWKIWICVPIVYGFSAFGISTGRATHSAGSRALHGPICAAEGSSHTDAATLRAFLEQDDGKEFIMLNQVQIYENDIATRSVAK